MSVRYMTGSIFDSYAEALVNPVNCKGVHGKGLALEFKKRFPDAVWRFNAECKFGRIKPGDAFTEYFKGKHIVFLATKDDWRNPSKLEWVKTGLLSLADEIGDNNIRTVAIPALGCGCGGLAWDDVRPLIEEAAVDIEGCGTSVLVYPPISS